MDKEELKKLIDKVKANTDLKKVGTPKKTVEKEEVPEVEPPKEKKEPEKEPEEEPEASEEVEEEEEPEEETQPEKDEEKGKVSVEVLHNPALYRNELLLRLDFLAYQVSRLADIFSNILGEEKK